MSQDSLIQEVRYENIIAAWPELDANQEPTGKVFIEFAEPEAGVEMGRGDKVTLETNASWLMGVKYILDVTESPRGYRQIKVQGSKKLVAKLFNYSTLVGRVYFGKVNVLAEQGGTATFIAKSDAGKVIGLAVGGFIMAVAAWALLSD